MGTLVDDLLHLARLDQGRPLERAPVDVGQLVEDAVRDARAVEPDREIAAIVDEPVTVLGDSARLHQVVANLLANARVHAPGAPIEVRVHEDDGSAVIDVRRRGSGHDGSRRGTRVRAVLPGRRIEEPAPRRQWARALDRRRDRPRPRRHRHDHECARCRHHGAPQDSPPTTPGGGADLQLLMLSVRSSAACLTLSRRARSRRLRAASFGGGSLPRLSR